MRETEATLRRLRQSIEDAKHLKRELRQQIADLDKKIEEARKTRAKAAKRRSER